MSGVEVVWMILGAGLVAYSLTAGADFGGGAWDLLATGPRRDEQRRVIEHAIAPIWEANHVWLIFVIVLTFGVFPVGYAVISTALHVPLAAALVGIVLRGAAFTFRAYGIQPDAARRRWGHVFAWSSLVTPVFLGVTLGALSTGAIRAEKGRVLSGFLAGWLEPFSWAVGLFAVVLFALLAAVYLVAETTGPLQDDFRRRALAAELAAGFVAALVLWRASVDAPVFFERLLRSPWSLAFQGGAAAAALVTMAALWRRRPRIARVAVAVQVGAVVLGWGLAMGGHLVLPDVSIHDSGARPAVIAVLLPALCVGALLLGPSLVYLFRVFKGRRNG